MVGDLAGFPFRGLLNEELFCEYSVVVVGGLGWRVVDSVWDYSDSSRTKCVFNKTVM